MQQLPPRPKLVSGPSRHVYDVVLLGGQLAGALAGALLAKRGYRVLLIEHDGLGPGYEHKDFILPYAPFVAPPLKAMPAAEAAFIELGLAPTLQRALKPIAPGLQLVAPRHRIDIFQDAVKRKTELLRELPDQGEGVEVAFARLVAFNERSSPFFRKPLHFPPEGWLGNWRLQRELKKHPAVTEPPPTLGEDLASQMLVALTPFITFLSEAQGLSIARTLSGILESPGRYPGGREALREVLLKKLSESGGDYLGPEDAQSSVVESLSFEGKRLVGVKVMGSDTVYRAPFVIAATDAGALRRLIPDKKRQRALSESLELVNTKRFLFTVNWVVPVEVLPKGMGELLLLETDAELGPMLVQVGPARKEGGREDESLRVVCAAAAVPSGTRELGEPHQEKLAQRIGGEIEKLMPFAKEKLVLQSAPYLDARGTRGSRLLPHPLYQPLGPTNPLGVLGLGPHTPTKNLILASREVFPGLGLEGELLSATMAVDRVQEALKKLDPLKR
jgi:phytoene dehydrogenase-like protein